MLGNPDMKANDNAPDPFSFISGLDEERKYDTTKTAQSK